MPARPFARIARAEARPGHCIRCPRNTDLLDLGSEAIQDYGVLYLCTVCFAELADNMEMVTKAVHLDVTAELNRSAARATDRANTATTTAALVPGAVASLIKELTHGISDLADRTARALSAVHVPDSEPVPVPVPDQVPADHPAAPAAGEPDNDADADDAAILAALGLPGASATVGGVDGGGDGATGEPDVDPAGDKRPARVSNGRRR